MLFATGLDPDRSTVFIQSQVAAHPEAAWLLGSATSFGELSRMTQFKDRREQQDFVSAGMFTYPVLMAGDILLYQTDQVPIGDDQRQHLELARNVAERFNQRYGETFTIPEGVYPEIGARIMDLQEPDRKMSTTGGTPQERCSSWTSLMRSGRSSRAPSPTPAATCGAATRSRGSRT